MAHNYEGVPHNKWTRGSLWLETVYYNTQRRHKLLLKLAVHYPYWQRAVRLQFGGARCFVLNPAYTRAVVNFRAGDAETQLREVLLRFSRWWARLRFCTCKTVPPFCGAPAMEGSTFCGDCVLSRAFTTVRDRERKKRRRLT